MDWKEEFKKLYFSPNVEDIPKAMEIKRANMPLKLYRYRPLKNIGYFEDEVINAHLYMANPKTFNDPFDSSSVLKIEEINSSNKRKSIFREWIRSFADRSVVRSIFNHKDWFERLNEYCSNLVSQNNKKKYKNTDELSFDTNRYFFEEFEKLNEHINRLATTFSKVVCFTESKTNLPMWNHYADGHSGICLEYTMPKIIETEFVKRMFPVFYVNELPDGIGLIMDSGINRITSSDYLLLHKLEDWSYEKEWRLVYDASFWYDGLKDIPESFYREGRVIDFMKPSKIYIGYQIGEDKEAFVREIGTKYNIPVVKMKCTNYGLKAEDEL